MIALTPGTKIHMLGIGGIGMSALARYLHGCGCVVSGYDRTETAITRQLAADGIPVAYTQHPDTVLDKDLIIYTPAVHVDSTELDAARAAGKPVYKRSQVLGQIARQATALAVGGTHGKTTTSSMAAWLLHATGQRPSAFIGGVVKNFGSNYLAGRQDLVVVEADEFDRSFLTLFPQVAVITAADPDHLDIYGTADEVLDSYRQFATQVQPGGTLLLSAQLREVIHSPAGINTQYYGIETGDWQARNLRSEGITTVFDIDGPDGFSLRNLVLRMPGSHNVLNMTGAIAAVAALGVPAEEIGPQVAGYQGVWRRFDIQLETPQVVYIDDYAHHPEELRAVLGACRELFPTRRLVACFQPHLYSRTRDFYQGFAEALNMADAAILLHIYPARELSIPHVTSDLIYQHIHLQAKQLINLKELPDTVSKVCKTGDVVITLGAGDIDTQVQAVALRLQQLAQ